MPDATTLIAVIGGLLVVLVVAGIVWWVNRTPTGHRQSRASELPLYSISLPSGVTEAPDVPVAPPVPPPASRRRDASREPTPKRSAAPPVATPAAAPRSAAAAPAAPPPVREPSAVAPSAVVPEPDAAGGPSVPVDEPPPSAGRIREFTTAVPTAPSPAAPAPAAASPAPPSPTAASGEPPASRNGAPTGERSITAHGVPGTEVEGHLVKYSVPQDGTLQFLPGRLQVLDGQDAGREVRFVRVPGPDGTTVTFGRSEGPAYRHIQLREATVSRSHARLRLADGCWQLTNLSETNPVVVNGRTMEPGEELPVVDGDRIEMGEVVFGFRSK